MIIALFPLKILLLLAFVRPVDAAHFGVCREVAWRHAEIGREHWNWLQANHRCNSWAREAAWNYSCWCQLSDALTPEFDLDCRLEALHRLKAMLGREAYYAGEMPDPVPLWRFTEITNPKWQPRGQ